MDVWKYEIYLTNEQSEQMRYPFQHEKYISYFQLNINVLFCVFI